MGRVLLGLGVVLFSIIGFTKESKSFLFNSYVELNECHYDVKDFGAIGDGYTDDTSAIQTALVEAIPWATVCIGPGTYLIDAVQSVRMLDRTRLKLHKDTILKAKPNNSSHYTVLKIRSRDDVIIEGGTILGERNEHFGEGGEWGFGIDIRGSTNVTVRNININDCWGDGVYIGGDFYPDEVYPEQLHHVTSRNIDIVGVVAKRNRRQGLSITSGQNIAIMESEFSDTSGTPPSAGIDIEPDGSEPIENINIIDVLTQNNAYGVLVALGTHDNKDKSSFFLDGHVDVGSEYGFYMIARHARGKIKIYNSNWTESKEAFRFDKSYFYKLKTKNTYPKPVSWSFFDLIEAFIRQMPARP